MIYGVTVHQNGKKGLGVKIHGEEVYKNLTHPTDNNFQGVTMNLLLPNKEMGKIDEKAIRKLAKVFAGIVAECNGREVDEEDITITTNGFIVF